MNEFLKIFENYYFRIIIITFISILITNFLKKPIKNKTKFLNESTRKIINIVILIIPFINSFILITLFLGVFQNIWLWQQIFDETVKSWFLSLSCYSIISRLWILVLGVINGEINFNTKVAKEIISNVKEEITSIEKNFNNKNNLSNIVDGIDKILDINEDITFLDNTENLEQITDVNIEINKKQNESKKFDLKIKHKNSKVQKEKNK